MRQARQLRARAIFVLLLILCGSAVGALGKEIEVGAGYFPLHKGSYWLYAAQVKWTETDGSVSVKAAEITWKTEILDVYRHENVEAARVRGFVHDLAWYEANKQPSIQIIVRVGSTHYYLIDNDVDQAWNEIIASDGESYLEALSRSEPLLEAPLIAGAHFGEVSQTPRDTYCYVVQSAEVFDVSTVRNAPPLSSPMEYAIVFRTNPDHSITAFVPGLGITRYQYCHHGTVASADARLIEFKP